MAGGKVNATADNLSTVPSFAVATAAISGQSARTVRQDAERGEKVIDEVINLIRGTKLDTGTYLDMNATWLTPFETPAMIPAHRGGGETMNRMLVNVLANLNAVLAVVIVLVGAGLGYGWAKNAGDNLTFGIGIGLAVGLIVAALICGLLATFCLIERHLRLIADDVEEMRARDAQRPS